MPSGKSRGARPKRLPILPTSASGMIEYANAMLMLEGEKMMANATHLYQQAAAAQPIDASERLDVEMAKIELED